MILAQKIEQLKSEQDTLKRSNDFVQIPRQTKDGVDYEVQVYGNPKHKYWGYEIVFREDRKGEEYIKSIGYGVEAESRTFNWCKVES